MTPLVAITHVRGHCLLDYTSTWLSALIAVSVAYPASSVVVQDESGSQESDEDSDQESDSDEEASGNKPLGDAAVAPAAKGNLAAHLAKTNAAEQETDEEEDEDASEDSEEGDEQSDSEAAASEDEAQSDEASGSDKAGSDSEGLDEGLIEEADLPQSAQLQQLQADRRQSNAQAGSSHQPALTAATAGAGDLDDIPFTIAAPATYQAFAKLVQGRDAAQLQAIVQRVRACNAIALATDNRRKLQVRSCTLRPVPVSRVCTCCRCEALLHGACDICCLCRDVLIFYSDGLDILAQIQLRDMAPHGNDSCFQTCNYLHCTSLRCH